MGIFNGNSFPTSGGTVIVTQDGFQTLAFANGVLTISGSNSSVDLNSLTVTNTSLVLSGSDVLELTDSEGNVVSADLSSLVAAAGAGTTNVSMAVNSSTNILTLTDSSSNTVTVDLSYLDITNTINTNMAIDASNVLTLTDSDSNTVTVDLSQLNTTNASAAIDSNTHILTITDSEGDVIDVDLSYLASSGSIATASINVNTNILTIADTDGNTITVDLSHLDNSADADKNYVHNQIASSTTWSVAHNLDKFVSVVIVDSAGSVVIGDVSYVDANNVTLTFSAAFSGKAYCN